MVSHASSALNPLREIHLDVAGTSRYIFGKGRLCLVLGFKRAVHGDQNDRIENITHDGLYEESGDADLVDPDRPKGKRKKRRAIGGASGSNHPPKKLRKDHGPSGNVSASTDGKSLAAIQELFECSTLNVEIGGGGDTYSISRLNLRTHHPPERFVISLDSSHHSSTNAADAEVASFVKSFVPPPSVITATVTTTIIANVPSALLLGAGGRRAGYSSSSEHFYGFRLYRLFSQLRGMDYDQLFAEFNVGSARQTCHGAESQRDGFSDQVSLLETTCFGLPDQASSHELFKEQCEAIQDEHVKVLSDRIAGLDSELMALALHLDEDFYPRFLTTIAGQRWIIGRGFRLAVMKCLQSLEYVTALRTVIGLAIDKGMQTGLVAGIDHEKYIRGLADVAAYDPFVEAKYVFADLAFHDPDFDLLSQLESQKDANIIDIMNYLRLDGPSTETLEVSRLQPSYEQLLLPIHYKEDNVVIRETSYDHVQKLKKGAISHHTSISDTIGTLVDPLSLKNLIGEVGTSEVPTTTAATTTLTILVAAASASSIPPISMADYNVPAVRIQGEVPHSLKIVFEKETLETTPERPTTN
nr:hypothetical protein [Tanacetum cinerariifolium]